MKYDDVNLQKMVMKQVDNVSWLDDDDITELQAVFPKALERTYRCFKDISIPAYHDAASGDTVFNILRLDQYIVFLYYLSNTLLLSAWMIKSIEAVGIGNRRCA